MDIKSLLNQFKILDKNNDGILQASEVKNNSFKNSVWENIAKPETSLVDFVITGLSIESANPEEQTLSAFDKMHAKLVKQNVYPGTYLNGYCYYSNGVKLYTKEVQSYDEIPNFPGCDWAKDAKGVDISNLKLSDEQLLNMIIDDYTTMSDEQKLVYEKAKASMNQMGCGIEKLHEQGFRGSGAMALLDQKFCPHKMFADKFTSTTDVGANALNPETRPSWHTAGMMSIMHKTAPDAEIVHYNVTNEDTKVQDEQFAQAIRDIIEKNKTLPDEKKIKTIVMGWGFYPNNPKYEEYINLCKEAVESGIFISSNNSHELYGISTMGADRDPKADVNSAESYRLCAFDNADNHKDIKKDYHDNLLYFPMQHLTIGHEDGESIQYDGNSAGVCWANSVGALYNDFISIKPDLKPKEFMELLLETSDELTVDGVYCGRLLNASAAAEKLKNN